MNQFITTDLGGLPLRLDDFRFMQDAWRQGFEGIAKIFGYTDNDTFALTKPEINGLNYSEFFVCHKGEIWKFPGGSIANPPAGFFTYAVFLIGNDSNGDKVFANGTTSQTYETREIILSNLAPSDSIAFDRVLISDLLLKSGGNVFNRNTEHQVIELNPSVDEELTEITVYSKYVKVKNLNSSNLTATITKINNPNNLDQIVLYSGGQNNGGGSMILYTKELNVATRAVGANMFFEQNFTSIGAKGINFGNSEAQPYFIAKLQYDPFEQLFIGELIKTSQTQGLG